MNERIEFVTDPIAEQLDELSDLAEYWKKNREKGRMPPVIRHAMLIMCEDIVKLLAHERADAG